MKKTIILVLTSIILMHTLCFNATTVLASDSYTIEELGNGFYCETIIIDNDTVSLRGSQTMVTKTKSTNIKDSNGNLIWSVSIQATFSYDGATSDCIRCKPVGTAYISSWTIKNVTSSKNGESATATAVAIRTTATGTSSAQTKSVTIKCSATGVVS